MLDSDIPAEDREKLYDIIIKSLSLAPLSLDDVMTLSLAGDMSVLLDHYGLSYDEALVVKNHLKGQILRLNAQVSSYRHDDEKYIPAGHVGGSPGLGPVPQIKESKLQKRNGKRGYRISEGSLRKFVRRVLLKNSSE